MIDARLFDDLAENLGKLLPPGVSDMKSDFEKNAKTVLQSTLNKMDLVTREEFDIQAAVLQKTRARLKALEERLDQLDGNGESASSSTDNPVSPAE